MMAIRDHPLAAEAMGIDIAMLKTRTFAVSAHVHRHRRLARRDRGRSSWRPTASRCSCRSSCSSGWWWAASASHRGAGVRRGVHRQFMPNVAEQVSKAAPGAIYGVILIAFMYLMPGGVAGACRQAVAALAKRRAVPLPDQTRGALAADAPATSDQRRREQPMLDRRTLLRERCSPPALPSAAASRRRDARRHRDQIKIGNTIPYSGPASAYGAIGRGRHRVFQDGQRPGRHRRPQDQLHLASMTAIARRRRSSRPAGWSSRTGWASCSTASARRRRARCTNT